MQINTSRFGALTIDPEKILHFPLGLLGFETVQRFIQIDSEEITPMRWLQAVDEPTLSFLVVEPGLFFPDYTVPLADADEQMLQVTPESELVVACLVVIPEDPKQMTVNLMGPLVVNADKRLGKQVVLHDSGYSTRQRLLPDAANSETPALV